MSDTLHDRDGEHGANVLTAHHSAGTGTTAASWRLFVRVNVAAVAVAGAGLFLPKVTAGGYGLATLRTGYGQVFALLLVLVCAALAGWYATRADWFTAALLFVAWLGLLATAAFEVVRVSASSSDQFGLTGVGVGLYCNVVGAAAGAAAATIEAVRRWTDDRPQSRSDRWLPWMVAVSATVLTLAAVGVSGQLAGRDALLRSAGGVRASFSLGGARAGASSAGLSPVEGHRPPTPPSASTTAPAPAGAPTGVTGGFGSTGGTGSGNSGNSGDWGMVGGLATFWPGYTGAPGSFYIWPGYLGPPDNTGVTGGTGSTVTGASGLPGTGVTGGTGPTAPTAPTGTTGPAPSSTTTTTVPTSSSVPIGSGPVTN
jgi:hypothetical protein